MVSRPPKIVGREAATGGAVLDDSVRGRDDDAAFEAFEFGDGARRGAGATSASAWPECCVNQNGRGM